MENEKQEQGLIVKDFSEMGVSQRSKQSVYTTIQDERVLFNLQSSTDYKLNDCKGETIRVKGLFMKFIEKPLEKPEVNEETGEIIKDKEIKKITILVDDQGKSYVTASKTFANQMVNYVQLFGIDKIEKGELVIKITERAVKNSSNKALGFELAI